MVHGDNKGRSHPIGHFDGLLGRAMIADPRLVRADGHDGRLEWTSRAVVGAEPGMRRTPAEQQSLSFAAEHVAVVATLLFTGPTLSPVFHFERFDFEFPCLVPKLYPIIPAKLGDPL